ncbi:hypothetical protein HQQ94_19255 [Shewanella sp. VB17]|uniref:hypothetical protein n=1 Tax=Shewanella sp. VB17 TaxID=2739432 RepID=UPI001563DE69|nr:hypothetical protein [Shewanella sp. VB17]NRD75322.1 hypothetical protein [Shewanella sp. VB17]
MKLKHYKTFLTASALTLCSFTALNSVAAIPDGIEMNKRCNELDLLTPLQARGRLNWARACGHITSRDLDFYMYDDNGSLRRRPKYPSFFNPANFNDWLIAPTAVGGSCELGSNTNKIYCIAQ